MRPIVPTFKYLTKNYSCKWFQKKILLPIGALKFNMKSIKSQSNHVVCDKRVFNKFEFNTACYII